MLHVYKVYIKITYYVIVFQRSGDFVEKRKQQQKSWMWAHIEQELKYRYYKLQYNIDSASKPLVHVRV